MGNLSKRVAIVYDRVNKWGGAERLLLVLHELFPTAPLFTSVYNPSTAPWAKQLPRIEASFLQKFPFVRKNHELFPYLMPIAFENFDFKNFDLVISVSSEAAKGIITGTKTFHVSICLTPTRYLWGGYYDYFKAGILSVLLGPLVSYLRRWDTVASKRPDLIIAISQEVKKRVEKYYQRDSILIYPPISINIFESKEKKENFFLLVNRLVPYKKTDFVIKVFNKRNEKLVIIGSGTEEKRLRRMAGKNIIFIKNLTDEELSRYYQRARALIFPQEEDFGLVALEAQFYKLPVIALARGGALETIVDGKTGIFFDEHSDKSLNKAIDKFKTLRFQKKDFENNVKRFSKEIFKKQFIGFLSKYLK